MYFYHCMKISPIIIIIIIIIMSELKIEFQQEFTKHLPTIYQWFTKDLPKIRPYLAFYLLKTYQGFTKDLPKTYQRFTKSTKHLPKAIKYFFNLPKIYQQFTKNVWTKIFWYFYSVFSQKYLATIKSPVFIKTWSANWL